MSQSIAPLPREPLLTARLRLEPAREEFAAAAHEVILASQPEFARWFLWAGDPQPESTRSHAALNEANWDWGMAYNFFVFLDDQLIGNLGLRVAPQYPKEASMGYWLGSAWQGQGYMSEASLAVRDFGLDRVGLARLELAAGVDNLGSQRIAEKMGMRREGLMRSAAWSGGQQPYDCYLYAMLRDEARRDTGGRYAGERASPTLTEPDFTRGLVTAVVQDEVGDVLMVAHMNEEAYALTLESGHAWFWSRSRERLWEKGETSGDHLDVRSITIDCDGDAVLLRVSPHGPACHTGARSCFHNPVLEPYRAKG